jgi:type IV pilus assembly protein PilX
MSKPNKKQEGFVLVVALILLAVVSLLAANGMGVTTMNERMAGNYMDRGRAQAAAEQALTQAQDVLRENADACLLGCTGSVTNGSTTANISEVTTAVLPATWVDANKVAVTLATDQATRAQYVINWLNNSAFTTDSFASCKAYSIMGRGQGIDTSTFVILQTVTYVCPAA